LQRPKFTTIASICAMSTNEERRPFSLPLRQGGAILRTLGGRAGRLADSFSSPQGRRARRHARRWLETHGLTIVLVSGMMVVAWLIAAH
jgi:hypothetical protein